MKGKTKKQVKTKPNKQIKSKECNKIENQKQFKGDLKRKKIKVKGKAKNKA